MTVLLDLAACVHAVTNVSDNAAEAVKRAVADLMTAAVTGAVSPGGRAVLRAGPPIFGSGRARCWFTDRCSTPAGATFVNAAVASMLDLDDGHRAAAGHPGAAVIPAVLAASDGSDEAESRVITAIAIGYEVGVRIARSRDFAKLDTVKTGRWCGPAVAAAVGWLWGLSAAEIAQAMGIAYTTGPSLIPHGTPAVFGNVKEGIAWASATGVAAVDLAKAGFTGSVAALDDPRAFDRSAVIDDFGQGWLVETIYFKPYSCCRWIHAALDGLGQLLVRHSVTPEAIDAIEVETFSRGFHLSNEATPTTLEGAQYSFLFALAVQTVHGQQALLPMQENLLGDPRVEAVARRVRLSIDPVFDAVFPATAPARVTLAAHGMRRSVTVTEPWGEPGNPMGWDDLFRKQETAISPVIGTEGAQELALVLHDWRRGALAPLRRVLATPLHALGNPPRACRSSHPTTPTGGAAA